MKTFLRDKRGGTGIEFALIAPVLFLMLLSLVEIGVLGMTTAGLDNAVVDVAREIRTGQDTMPTSATEFEDAVCARIVNVVPDCAGRITVGVRKFSTFAAANATTASAPAGEYDPGGPGDIILVKADYRWPLITPFPTALGNSSTLTEVTIASRAAFKNEPYE